MWAFVWTSVDFHLCLEIHVLSAPQVHMFAPHISVCAVSVSACFAFTLVVFPYTLFHLAVLVKMQPFDMS